MSDINRRRRRRGEAPTRAEPVAGQVPAFANPTAAASFPTTRNADDTVEFAIPKTSNAVTLEIHIDGIYSTTVGFDVAFVGLRNLVDGQQVTFVLRDDTGAPITITGPQIGQAFVPNSPTTGNLVLEAGSVLEVGGNVSYDTSQLADANGIPPDSEKIFRWWRRDPDETEYVQIGGEANVSAIRRDYDIPNRDNNGYLKLRVNYFDNDGHPHEVWSDEIGPVGVAAATNSPAIGQPVISGTTEVGSRLTLALGTMSDANGLPPLSEMDVQWYRGDDPISGADMLSYDISQPNSGFRLKASLSFVDADGFSEVRFSQETAIITSAGAVDPAHKVVSASGNNGGAGTAADPWRDLDYAFGQVGAGGVILMRDGKHFISEETLSNNGTAANPITVKNYPGEFAELDASPQGLTWVLHDAASQTYKTTKTNWRGEVPTGHLFHNGAYYALVPYYPKTSRNSSGALTEKSYGLPDLMSDNHDIVDNDHTCYAGPGVCVDGGVMYIRLQKVRDSALGRSGDADSDAILDSLVDYSPATDTANFSATDSYNVINFSGSCKHIIFDGITFSGAKSGFKMASSASDIAFNNCKFRTNMIGLPSDNIRNLYIDSCTHELNMPLWVSWTNMKGGVSGQQTMPAVHWAMKLSGIGVQGVDGLYIRNSHFNRTMDIFTGGGDNIEVSGNSGWVIDDSLQLDITSEDVSVFNNRMKGVMFGYQGRGASKAVNPGRVWIFNNVCDARPKMLWGKRESPNSSLRSQGPMRASQSGWGGQKPLSGHGSVNSGGGRGFPVKVYNNLFYTGQAADGYGLEIFEDMNDSGEDHVIRNNILIASDGSPHWHKHSARIPNIDIDGNMYWRIGASGRFQSNLVKASGSGSANYSTLAAFLNSSDNPKNWDVNSTDNVDPMINASLTGLLAGSPAIGAAIANEPGWPSSGHGNIGPFSQAVTVSSFVSIETNTVAASSMNVRTTYTSGTTNRTAYWPTSDPSEELQTTPELSTTYAIHNQTITGMTPETEYTLQPQVYNGVTWDNAGSSITETTLAVSTTDFVVIQPNEWTETNGASTTTHSTDWTGSNGFAPDGANTDAYRVQVDQGDHFGASDIFELSGTPKHVVMSYRVFMPSNTNSFWSESDENMKMPGLTGDVSAANGGYGGSQDSALAHDQRAWSLRQQMHRPHASFPDYAMGMELYWHGSQNPGSANEFDNEFADTIWYSSAGNISSAASLNLGTWHTIEIEAKMNDINVDNGFFITRLDGVIGHQRQNFQFTKSADRLLIKRIWLDVYHGGSNSKGTAGTISMFFRDIKYKIIN